MKKRITMVSMMHRDYPHKQFVHIYRGKKSHTWRTTEAQAERITEIINSLIEAGSVNVSLQTDGWFITVPNPLPVAKMPRQKPVGCPYCNFTGVNDTFDWVPYGNTNVQMPSSEPCMYCNPDSVQ